MWTENPRAVVLFTCKDTCKFESFPKGRCIVPCIPTVISPGTTTGKGESDIDVNVTYGWAVVEAIKINA